MDYKKKKPWKNLNFSKAITRIFTGFISFSLNPSTPSILSEQKLSQYECPCGYHSRQRAEHRRRLEEANRSQQQQNTAEDKIHVHGGGFREGNDNTGILLITDYKYNDKEEQKGENILSLDDAYALVSCRSRSGGAADKELEDVDERAEKFIKEFREQLRIQTVLSSEKEYTR